MRTPTEQQKEALQQFYLSSRNLLASGAVPDWAVQRSFEEALHGFFEEDSWRPTHISESAAAVIASGTPKDVQRAHGLIEGRLDRYERTLKVLTSPEQPFDAWWRFYTYHDSTVLITKDEHTSNRSFLVEDLIPIPQGSGLFQRSGFSFSFRKKKEVAWAQATLISRACKRSEP